jgi:hypothetical protein
MSSIWGLTNTDFHNCFTNDFDAAKVFFAGALVAGAVALVALNLLNRGEPDQSSLKNTFISTGIGTIAGFCASAYVAYHCAPIEVAADKVLKFLALTVVSAALGTLPAKEGAFIGVLTFGGGVWPVFGSTPLYYLGLYAALSGASYIAGRHSRT